MKYLIISVLFFNSHQLFGQTISVGWGPLHNLTEQEVRIKGGKDELYNSTGNLAIGLIYPITKKFDAQVNLSRYHLDAMFRLSPTTAIGYTTSEVLRIDIGGTYNLLNPNYKIFIKPMLFAGFQFAKKYADFYGDIANIYGPFYYQTKIPYSEGKDNFQIVPCTGLKTGVTIKKRFELGISALWVQGFTPFSKIYLDYTYKNDPTPQPTAIFVTKGTGLFTNAFIAVKWHK